MTPLPQSALWLTLCLKSDTTFSRGDGLAGVVDDEVQHDEFGLPYVSGKTLKGLLDAECAETLFALSHLGLPTLDQWRSAAGFLFGAPGSREDTVGRLRIGDGHLPSDLRSAIRASFDGLTQNEWGRRQRANLDSLTSQRRQTALDARSGAPLEDSLRTMRVILRQTEFVARLDLPASHPERAPWLLAACVKALRRAGTGRHRGRGRLQATLYDRDPFAIGPEDAAAPQDLTATWFARFEQEVRHASANVSS